MKCPYCQQEAYTYRGPKTGHEIYDCDNHLIRVRIYSYGFIFIVNYKEKTYAMMFGEKQFFVIEEWELLSSNPHDYRFKSTLLTLPHTPNLTPENAADKLKTILIFL